MPLYGLICSECGTPQEVFCHVPADRGTRTPLCGCGATCAPVVSLGRGLTFFEEGRPRVIRNLGDQPVTVTSARQHADAMRAAGVDWATRWPVQKTGGWV